MVIDTLKTMNSLVMEILHRSTALGEFPILRGKCKESRDGAVQKW